MKKKNSIITIAYLLICTSVIAQLPTINTIAGNGTNGYSGDGGMAILAELNNPYGVAVDGFGNVYIADRGNSVIRKVTVNGIISTFAGNGTFGYSGDGDSATLAALNYPTGVAVDGFGNVYIADQANNCIRKVTPDSIISTIAGTGTNGFSGNGGPAISAKLSYPTGVAVDGSGNVYIADEKNFCIRKVNTNGIISTFAGTAGTSGFSGDGGKADSAELVYPADVTVDVLGNVYIADEGADCIRKVNTGGIISTVAGIGKTAGYSGDGGAAVSAELNGPTGVAVQGCGNLYIADVSNNCIRNVNTSDIISTFAGTTTAGFLGDGGSPASAELNYPYGVAVDGIGNVYIADATNNRIRKVTTTAQLPFMATISGNGIGCQSISAVFTGSNGTPPYTFSYQLTGYTSSTIVGTGMSSTATLSVQNIPLGTYTCSLISVKDANPCSSPTPVANQSATINVYTKPNAIFTVSPQQTNILIPTISIADASLEANNWMWDFGDSTVSFSPNPAPHNYSDTGTYTIKLVASTNMGCKDSTYQTITITPFFTLYIPNTFTPTEDNINDVFMPKGEGITNFEMTIYDRWGNVIFYTTDINKGWNGKANGGGQVAQTDTYVYMINLTDSTDKHTYTYNGTFNLLK